MDQEMDSAAERQKPKPKTKTAPFRHSQTSDVGFDSHRPLQIVTPKFAVSLPLRSCKSFHQSLLARTRM